jgi:hypothetical protein
LLCPAELGGEAVLTSPRIVAEICARSCNLLFS